MEASNTLEIAFIQSDLIWENPIKNREKFTSKIKQIEQPVDLIILPEMFTTGFTMNAKKFAELMNGETVLWMQEVAASKKAALVGSIIIIENDSYYNRLLFVYPSGKIAFYDKKHTFSLAGEGELFSSGNKKCIIKYKGWKICPLICYDLRFPVWARNTENYDLLLYIANWPKRRINAWDALLKARAIENMSYTIGVNRVGKDIHNYEYTGNSIALDCLGEHLSNTAETKALTTGNEIIISKTLCKKSQDALRNKFLFLKDRDAFSFE
ncbi:nitrilase family protein [Tenacibaculum maritimum]|uniref:nitrilase family protein n=1 Tax=Tenacibaculum maritimum TaxID=107401 RepID=UPI0012E4C249|nr:nitrilase family protein [Tenacibaculum maritimum]CAA0208081.1 putative C-N hydrolase family amidase [Tenacibaculum maritimum]